MNDKAKFFKALGDESRLKIVGYLLKEDYCAGILKCEKKGRNIIYSIIDENTKNLLKNIGIPGVESCCNMRAGGSSEHERSS